MNSFRGLLGLPILLWIVFPFSSIAEYSATGDVCLISQFVASNNVEGMSNAISRMFALWPVESATYLAEMRTAISGLSKASSTNALARHTLRQLVSRAMDVTVPTNQPDGDVLLMRKCDAVTWGLCFPGVGDDHTILLGYARFVGDIRSLIIPNYVNQWKRQVDVDMATPLEERSRQLRLNADNKIRDEVQRQLRLADGSLLFHLFANVGRAVAPLGKQDAKQFLQDVKTAARLSEEEGKKLAAEMGVAGD